MTGNKILAALLVLLALSQVGPRLAADETLPYEPAIAGAADAHVFLHGGPPAGPPGRANIKAAPLASDRARLAVDSLTSGPTWGKTASGQLAVEITPEIEDLARGLRNDPKLIYEFVKNVIDPTPIWGSVKGATMALLDRRGNSFDQTSLLIAILRAAGLNANYIHGLIRLNANQIENWLGVGRDPDVVGMLLGSAGIPATVYVSGGRLVYVELEHVWAKVTIGGTDYVFDPTFKSFTYATGIDVAAAMGYDQTTFLARVTEGATLGPDYVQNLNRNNLHADLATLGLNLANHVRTTIPGARLQDVIGGREIVFTRNEAFRTTLPYEIARYAEWTEIPASYDVLIRIEHLGIDVTLASATTYGKRLSLFTNDANAPELRLDGELIATGNSAPPGSYNPITLSVDHPYAALGGTYGDQTFTTSIQAGGDYVIMNGFAGTGREIICKHQATLRQELLNGLPEDSEPVRGETLAVFALTWLGEVSESEARLDKLAKTTTIQHHTLGFAGQLDSPYVDIPMALVSVISTEENPDKESAAFFAQAGISSAFEWGIFDQAQGRSAVCTVKLIDISSAKADKIFDATSANYYSSVKPQLVNYSAGELALVEAYINAGFRLTLPQDGDLNEIRWTGIGFIAIDPTESSIGHIISGGLSGGYGSDYWWADPYFAGEYGYPGYWPYWYPQSQEPIDLVTGGYLVNRLDLSIGSQPFPLGLALQRAYASGGRLTDGPFGNGWSHNFDIRVSGDSDGFQGLGEDSPIDAASALAELYVAQDLLQGTKTNLRLVTGTLAHRWFMDRLIRNVVTVREGASARVFVELPDGSFNAPPGMADDLVKEGDGSYRLSSKHGIVHDFDIDGHAASWADPNGNTITFTYDAGGLLQSVANSAGRTLAFSYSGNHVSTLSDGTGRTVGYSYDAGGNLVSVTDPENQTTTFEYDLPGRLVRIFSPSDPLNPYVENSYDAQDRVITQTNGNGHAFTYYYSPNRTEEENPLGESHTVYFNRFGRTTLDINALGGETAFNYDGQLRVTSQVSPEGNSVTYEYDNRHNVTKISLLPKPPSSDPALVKEFSYETTFNRMTSAKDALGRITSTFYDTSANLTRIDLPQVGGDTPQFLYTYNSRGQIVTETDPGGMVTRHTYDALTADHLTVSVDDGGLSLTMQMTYDAAGNRTQSIDPRGHATAYAYDAKRELSQVTTPPPFLDVSQFSYDGEGNLTTIERETGDPLEPWQTIAMTYTRTNKKATHTDPEGNTTSYEYDAADLLTKLTDAEAAARGTFTEYRYDAAGRLERIIDGRGIETQHHTYTANGKRASLSDSNDNLSTYQYDAYDRLSKVVYPDGSFEQFTYDAVGNLVERRTRAGMTITFAYDALNRLTTKTLPGPITIQYAYDLAGHLQSITGPEGTTQYDYDTAGRVTRVTQPDGKALDYGYDAVGNRTRLTYPDGYFVTYEYDAANRITDVLEGGSTLLAHYEYDPLSRRVQVLYGNGTTTTYSYESDDDLIGLTHQFVSETRDLGYSHDLVGNRLSFTRSAGTLSYSYDAAYQLAEATDSGGLPAAISYELDGAGNRITVTQDGVTTPYTTNNLNQYTSVGGRAYGYDASGNLTSDGLRTFAYDTENHLIQVVTPKHDISYGYDAFGRRISKSVMRLPPPASRTGGIRMMVTPPTLPVVTHYLYDKDRLIAEYDADGTLLRRYVFGPGLDEPIMMQSGSEVYYYHHDALGSVVHLSGSTGQRVEDYEYGPFGEPKSTSAVGNPFLFAGRYYDGDSALYDFRSRAYEPCLGRFLQTDPIGYVGGVNLYAYVRNNAINLVDPYGLAPGFPDELLGYGITAGIIGASFIPGVGEAMDIYTLFAADSAWWERGLSLLSLGINIFTAGMLPNFGAAGKAVRAGSHADEVIDVMRGRSVLGHYPEYVNLAEELGARRFNIPGEIWDRMTDAERWTANQKFLDRMIRRGDEIILATPVDRVRPGSYFSRELDYLFNKGYTVSADGTRLIPPP
ncbi:MAG: RHS repeat-associated core domain-containing protein [Planctomycetota bacterium]